MELLKTAFPADTTIKDASANVQTGEIRVCTQGGGVGTATARRGVTPWEADLLLREIGLDSVYSQATAVTVFGRIYGQGVLEVPVAFQAACCLAAMDTLRTAYPDHIIFGAEDMPGKIGGYIGAQVDIQGIPASVMAIANANAGGIGPDEDLEGNIMLGEKARVMKALGLNHLPTIVVESKAYVPSVCQGETQERIWIRANANVDNTIVYDALSLGAKKAQIPFLCSQSAYHRYTGEMRFSTKKFGDRIIEIGKKITKESRSYNKVKLIAELALLVSQDAGGITYMSADLHDIVSGGGLLPGTSSVLSMLVTENYIKKWKIPFFTKKDSQKYIQIIEFAAQEISRNWIRAQEQLRERFCFEEADFEYLLKKTTE